MPAADAAALAYDWEGIWARDNQLEPDGDAWLVWLILAGRGFGKTRTGSELVRKWSEDSNARVALVGRTAADVRDVMVEGESGILACSPPWDRPHYEPSKRRLTWATGAIATTYSADQPDLLRGPQHTHAWCDELAAWRRLQETWDNLLFGLRLGDVPRCVVTTTPRPLLLLRRLMQDKRTRTTRGATYDNLHNLAPPFREAVLQRYEGTTLGRQELMGELLDEIPGALWKRSRIDELRVSAAPELRRIVVAVDPSASSGADSDECGIVVAGIDSARCGYVLEDLSGVLSPDQWARRAVDAFVRWDADRIVYEANQGGDMVALTLRTVRASVPLTAVHARRGKHTRAEPVAALYEQGRVHHVGLFAQLEDQQCNWTPDSTDSPDRMDAAVYALTELMLGTQTVTARVDNSALEGGESMP
jgi:phage terminase large subunit-like protein